MKIRFHRLLAWILVLALLAGCSSNGGSMQDSLRKTRQDLQAQREEEATAETSEPTEPEDLSETITFAEMEYVRPDMDKIQAILDGVLEDAKGDDPDKIVEGVYAYYDAYDWFYTYYFLADIHYSMDLTDPYWEEEYNYCVECSTTVDAGLEQMYYALAKSPCRETLESEDYFGEGFFDGYDGENNWDETFTAMLEEEARLQSEYYALTAQATSYSPGTTQYYDAYANQMAQVLVDLIRIRQDMAAYWGYDSYPEFAWDFYYYRDYTPDQMMDYMGNVRRYLVPLYRETAGSGAWNAAYRSSSEEKTFQFVRTAAQNMGGLIWEAFQRMERGGLYDISYNPNKYGTSFEVFLLGYGVPFVFVCTDEIVYDRLTFAHEFGHFANDYATQGGASGIDVLEIFSQGMEFMTLCYGDADRGLIRLKMADCLGTFVEQSCFATFEMRAYELTGSRLTVENLFALYDRTAREFGFESVGYDRREFVTISHFFTNPMYIPSYVVSNDAALQLYQMELTEPGTGRQRLEDSLSTEESYFLAFLEEAGLESPFAPGRIQAVAETLRKGLLE